MNKLFQTYLSIVLTIIMLFVVYGVVSSKAYTPDVQQWEYQIRWFDDETCVQSLAITGMEGWELVYARRAKNQDDEFGYEIIFKKPLFDERQ